MSLNNISDQVLIDAYRNGDDSAIETLIGRHKDKVYNYILMLVKDRFVADDLFQELFIKVINSLKNGKYSDNGKFISWVLRVAHNIVIDYFRLQKQKKTISSDNDGYDILNNKELVESNIEDKIITEQTRTDVRKLVDFLPVEQREVVIMRHYLGFSFKEIAEHTGVSINTALGRMRYALMNLRKMIEENDIALSIT